MIETNALLSLGLSIVASFSNIVSVPQGAVPTRLEDLQKYTIACPPTAPTLDLWLFDRRGTRFEVRQGAVLLYSCPGSYRELEEPRRLPQFKGTPTLSSNQAVELAQRTLRRLVKGAPVFTNAAPRLRRPFRAPEDIPFYWISWPRTNSRGLPDFSAFMEVDARSGKITYLELQDEAFYDLTLAHQLNNGIYTAEPQAPSRWELQRKVPRQRSLSLPATNDVARAVASCRALCAKLGVEADPQSDLAHVDWERTSSYEFPPLSATQRVLQVKFLNGTCFEALDGVAFSYYASDACFVGYWSSMPAQEWQRFKGKAVRNWQELAGQLESTLTNKLGIPGHLLAPFSPGVELNDPKRDPQSIKRTVVAWRNWPRNTDRFVSIDATTAAVEAEFDLETGALKWLNFHEPSFVAALRLAQSKAAGQSGAGQGKVEP